VRRPPEERLPAACAAAVACLPFMDWPYMLGLSSYVRPLALFPVLLGCGALALRLLAVPGSRRLAVPRPFGLFLLFAAWAMAASPLVMLLVPGADAVKGQTPPARYVREVMGLGAGLVTYAYFTLTVRHWRQGVTAARILLLVFPLTLAAVLVQAGWLFLGIDALKAVDLHVLGLVQSRHALVKASGLAPEGSMLADQLTSTVIPFALAGLMVRHSLFRARPLGAPVELWALLGAITAVGFTLSRIGFVMVVLVFAIAFALQGLQRRAFRRRQRVLLAALPVIGLVALAAVPEARTHALGILGSLHGVGESVTDGVWSNVTRMGTQAAGFAMLAHHPFGVGTGGFPFHFAANVPTWATLSPEVQVFLGREGPGTAAICASAAACDALLPDAKGHLARVAAENGWVGLLLLGAMYALLVRRAWRAYRGAAEPALRHLALGCLISLGAMFPLSFNQSSYLWLHWYLVWALTGALPAFPVRRARPAAAPAAVRTLPGPRAVAAAGARLR
jgi:hypothetical protein